MIDRTKLLEVIRETHTKLIQQARVTQRQVSDAGMHEMRARVETVLHGLNAIGDTLDALESDDPEIDGKLDALADELDNELFGDGK
jgi:hypothetical protein